MKWLDHCQFSFFLRIWAIQHTEDFFFLYTVSDFVDGSDLYTLWRQEKKLDDTTVTLYSAELVITLGQRSFLLELICNSTLATLDSKVKWPRTHYVSQQYLCTLTQLMEWLSFLIDPETQNKKLISLRIYVFIYLFILNNFFIIFG